MIGNPGEEMASVMRQMASVESRRESGDSKQPDGDKGGKEVSDVAGGENTEGSI